MQKSTPFLWSDGKTKETANQSSRVMKAMLQMDEIEISGLQQAYEDRKATEA